MMTALVYGTRPELIKLFPVVRALEGRGVPHLLVNTGQHGGVLRELEGELCVSPHRSLDVLSHGLRDAALLARLVADISQVLDEAGPGMVVSQGDTFTVLASSMAAFMKGVPHAHVEAGLRSFDLRKPFPEEFNRRVASIASALHFAPTEGARAHLLAEGIPARDIHLVGNTIVDAVSAVCRERSIEASRDGLVYITTHRRENWGEPLRRIATVVRQLCADHPGLAFIWSLHPNPDVQRDIREALGDIPSNLALRHAIGYSENLDIIARSSVILSDSGGIQEEVACLGKDIIVLRAVTERPEVVEAGYATLCGDDPQLIHAAFERLIQRQTPERRSNPFGDGMAAERIVDAILAHGSR